MRRSPYVRGERSQLSHAPRPEWEREQYRLCVLYKSEYYAWLMTGAPRFTKPRGQYKRTKVA